MENNVDLFLFGWVEANLRYAILFVPLFAFAEACIGIGLFVSGFFLVAVSSIVVDQQLASLPVIALLAFFGAIAGDHVGFYVGRWVGPHLHHIGVVEKRKASFERAEKLIRYYGPFASPIAVNSVLKTLQKLFSC